MLIKRTDGIVCLRSGRDRLERAVQHLYPLELSCDTFKQAEGKNIKKHKSVTLHAAAAAAAAPFVPRHRAAIEVKQRISKILNNEQHE